MDPVRIYDYLTTARNRVMTAVRPLTPEQYFRHFDFGLNTIGSTLAHIMISEWYYIERLDGRTVPPYDEWPIKYESPPTCAVVEATWAEQAPKVRTSIAAQRDWNRTINWLSFADDAGKRSFITATTGDLLAQLALHEVHHRAQLMSMLRALGNGVTPVEDIDYNALMFDRRPAE